MGHPNPVFKALTPCRLCCIPGHRRSTGKTPDRLHFRAQSLQITLGGATAPTNGSQSDKGVLPGVDVLVVGAVAVHVRGAVDQPGDVEGDGVPQDGGKEVGVPQALAPEVPRHKGGDHKAHQHDRALVVPAGKPKDTVTVVGTMAGERGELAEELEQSQGALEESEPKTSTSTEWYVLRAGILLVPSLVSAQHHRQLPRAGRDSCLQWVYMARFW